MHVAGLPDDLTHVQFEKFACRFRHGNDSDNRKSSANAKLE